jgi:hypothetical protein
MASVFRTSQIWAMQEAQDAWAHQQRGGGEARHLQQHAHGRDGVKEGVQQRSSDGEPLHGVQSQHPQDQIRKCMVDLQRRRH